MWLARPRGTPSQKPHRPLYRSWVFWTVTGALVAGTVALTYAATRPAPVPYYGNLPPQLITLP
jgi:hypothetical protein